MKSSIAILGAGPSSLTVLDRLATQLEANGSNHVGAIHVFDPETAGCGVHGIGSAPYLLTNTVCSKVTVFDEQAPASRRASLFEWARDRSVDQLRDWGIEGSIEPDRCLPRRMLGEYLAWAFGVVAARLSKLTELHFYEAFVRDVVPLDGGDHYAILSSSVDVVVEAVIIATGHGLRRSTPRFQPLATSCPSSRQKVVIQGLGLTAIDRLMELTIGVGGRFNRRVGRELIYTGSGREPEIFLASRSGLPYSTRARDQKLESWRYVPTFLTRTEIDRLRVLRAGDDHSVFGKLEFESDIFPLLKLEMEKAFYEAAVRDRHGHEAALRFGRTFAAVRCDAAALQDELTTLGVSERFSWEKMSTGVPQSALQSSELYTEWFLQTVEADIVEARRGNLHSPAKAAADVLRDARDDIRYAVEFGGLSGESHREFLKTFFPLMKRLSIGPPLERSEQFLALLKQGVARVSLGPLEGISWPHAKDVVEVVGAFTKIQVDHIEAAFVDSGKVEDEGGGLSATLQRRGLGRRFANDGFDIGGLEVDNSGRLVNSDVEAPRIWALGTPVEGSRFYTFMLASPLDANEISETARRCARDVIASLSQRRDETSQKSDYAAPSTASDELHPIRHTATA